MVGSVELVTIGHIIQERIVFPDRESDFVLGSPPAYCSVAAARLGCRVGLVTRIGPDMPARLLEPFKKAGVDLAGLRQLDGEVTTTTRLVYDRQGNKTIEFPAKASPVRFEDIPQEYHSAKLFYVCTMDHDVLLDDIRRMADLGAEMAVDLGGYGGAHCKPVARRRGIPDELPAICKPFDIVKASDEDCRRILTDPRAEPESLGRQILGWGASIFVATLGEQGTLILTPGRRFVIPAFQGKAVDPTGGGDTYMGGFYSAYLRTRDVEYAGRFGAATALCVIEKTGGVLAERMPTIQMAEECMKRPTRRFGDADAN